MPALFIEKTIFFAIDLGCHLCCIANVHRGVGLFMGSLLCFIGLFVNPCPNTTRS